MKRSTKPSTAGPNRLPDETGASRKGNLSASFIYIIVKRRNLSCDGEAAAYIARCPAHFGAIWRAAQPYAHSHCRAIGSFFSNARTNGRAVTLRDKKKASVEEENIVFLIQASSMQYK